MGTIMFEYCIRYVISMKLKTKNKTFNRKAISCHLRKQVGIIAFHYLIAFPLLFCETGV